MQVAPHNSRHVERSRSPRIGTQTVELAIVLPIFFLVIFAAVEFFRLSMLRPYAENVSYEAARNIIVPGATANEAQFAADKMLGILGIKGATVEVTPAVITDSTGHVTVKVTIPTTANQWISPFFTSNARAAAETTLLTERVPSITVAAVPPLPPPPAPPRAAEATFAASFTGAVSC